MPTLNQTPDASRIQIGIFGKVNAGKSTLLNVLTGQEMAVVSHIAGTTTDPVKKSMELLPLGAVTIYDTPGLSDDGSLGAKRMAKTDTILRRIDMALLVIDASVSPGGDELAGERELLKDITSRGCLTLVVASKCDLLSEEERKRAADAIARGLDIADSDIIKFQAKYDKETSAKKIRNAIAELYRRGTGEEKQDKRLIADIIPEGAIVILVIPIDESAPKGRIILPQQQVLRELLKHGMTALCVQPQELLAAIGALNERPALVITDSQAFREVDQILPADIPLTSFSIIMSRFKGDLKWQAAGARKLYELEEGAPILISEGCTHHRQCGDIGTVKLPGWIKEKTGREFDYHFTSGGEFTDVPDRYELIIHCGGCTLPPREMAYRIKKAKDCGTAITNYGTMIASLHGILPRALEIFTGDVQ